MSKRMNRQNETAFTLVEIMVAILVVGLLAAIAIPQYSAYRTRAYNSAARADLTNLVTLQEAYFEEKGQYADDVTDLRPRGFRTSEGVELSIVGTGAHRFTATSYHANGDITYTHR